MTEAMAHTGGLGRFDARVLPRYKLPRLWRELGELPKSPYGKMLKRELKRLATGQGA